VEVPVVDFRGKLEELCGFVFKHGDERDRTRALLCSVFYHALHDRYYDARDMFLMAHVQDFIEKADIPTQILYNRTVVTLGLCAFRLGFYAKAHDCLSIICSGRTKELLAQGSFRSHDKDIEQEKQERRRQMPYHMHINPELLECCHLTCAMILELPHLARSMANGSSHIVVSRQLRKHLAGYNKQAFVGPPETTREHVLAATKAVLSGDWRRAYQYLFELEVWNLIPNDGGKVIKDLLRVRIQEEAVRCYLLLNSGSYDSMDLTSLCQMFELEQFQVRKIICRMIFQKEISASWEHSGTILHIYSTESSALQTTAVSVSEKLGQLLESNERIVDSLVGVYGYKDDWNTRDGKKQWHGQHNNNNQGHDNAAGARYKNRLKTSYRPVVHNNKRYPGSRNNKTYANKTDGSNNNNNSNNNNASSGNKNAWVQKRHNRDGNNGASQANQ
jgi:translation initiation factor 3 subunit C